METTIESLAMELSNMDSRLSHVETRLSQVEHRLGEVENKLDALDTKLQQVIDALLGNPLTQSGGIKHDMDAIAERVKILEKKQRELDDFRKRFFWTITLIIGAAVLLEFIVNLYSKIK